MVSLRGQHWEMDGGLDSLGSNFISRQEAAKARANWG
jgi:hypothetical protein